MHWLKFAGKALLIAGLSAAPTAVDGQTTAHDLMRRGMQKGQSGDLDGAIVDFTRAIDLDPRHPDGYALRGVAKAKKGELDGAISDYDRAIEIDPRYATAYVSRGTAKHEKQDFDAAIADYNRALELDSNYAYAYNNRGVAKISKSDPDGAMADFIRAIEIDPKCAPAYGNRGCHYLVSRDWKNALADLRENSKLREDKDYPRIFIWIVRANQGERKAASDELAEYFKKRGEKGTEEWSAKIIRFLLDKTSEAELLAAAASPEAKKESGQRCEAYFYAGMKRLLDGDKDGAAECFRKSLATNQKHYKEYSLAEAELKAIEK